MNGTIKITPAIKAEIARERARLELMRAHIVPTLRPVVIVARAGRARAIVRRYCDPIPGTFRYVARQWAVLEEIAAMEVPS